MLELLRRRLGARTLVVAASERDDGDVHPERVAPADLQARQRACSPDAWTMLDQVHGAGVVRFAVDPPWAPTVGIGDVMVVDAPERPVAVWAADCAPVLLAGADGSTLCAVHAGWRGLAAGVLAAAVDAMAQPIAAAVLGPCIHGCCYEFGERDLSTVAAGLGVPADSLRAHTSDGQVALDVPLAVAAGLERLGVDLDVVGACTGCDRRWFSHRVGSEPQRHALAGWFV